MLGHAGHTVVQAATGEGALDLVRTNQPELIVADLVMPGMNGYEFVRELRADPELRNIKVVFCTAAYDQGEVRSLAESCGVSHILVKPCEPEEIIGVVGEALSSNRTPASHIVTDQFDREQLRVLNAKLIQKLDELELSRRLAEGKAEQLAISLKYKSEFFSNMSHELRTPLNSLLILAGELEANHEENLTEAQVQYASTIRSSGNDLLLLLNDILDLAKVESGTVTLTIDELPLLELQKAVERDFRPVSDQQGLSFSVELAPGLPPAIATDASRLRQVLKNLLSNAFKFTEQGDVRLRVSMSDGGWSSANEALVNADAVLAFSVSDTGIGITADKQQLIFEAFAQADGTAAREYGGTGLGLSISRELVRLLGGEITLNSTVGEGSTFTLYLPRALVDDASPMVPLPTAAPAPKPTPVPELAGPVSNDDANGAAVAVLEAPAVKPALLAEPRSSASEPGPASVGPAPPALIAMRPLSPPAHPAGTGLAGMKVLVVDDDFRNIFALTALLKRVQVEVVSAESGEQGIAALNQAPDVDLVLVDIMMPGMDGYATMRAMRKLPMAAELPLVAFSAKVGDGERQRCIDAGASAYVPKPVDTAQLLAILGEWLPACAPSNGHEI